MPPKSKNLEVMEMLVEPQSLKNELEDLLMLAWLCSNSKDDIAHPIRFESVVKFDA